MKQKKEIHVLHIITRLDLGGAQKVCLTLFNSLPNYGVSTNLISGIGGKLAPTVQSLPRALLLKEFRHPISPLGLLTDMRCFIRLISIIRKLKKQYPNLIVHTHSTKAGIMGRWAAFFAGVNQRIHTIHGYAIHRYQNKLYNLFIYLNELMASLITSHFICVSSIDVKRGIYYFPRFGKKHSIIRAAVEWNKFKQVQPHKPFPQKSELFIFGTTASLKRGKNLFELLKAFEYVHYHNPNTKLEIVGGGPLKIALEKWIHNHNLENVVKLYGWQHDVFPIMKHWHCFSFSSLWEGLPCAVVEARLLKLPVVSYITGGIPDVINNGKNGLLYQQGDRQGLAYGMLAISQNSKLYYKLHSFEDDLNNFNDKNMIQQHIELYKNLIK